MTRIHSSQGNPTPLTKPTSSTVSGIRIADLSTRRPTPFTLTPDDETRKALANELGILGVRKLTFTGEIAPEGTDNWVLTGKLGATVVQACVVTLAPVTTRIDTKVTRRFLPIADEFDAGSEIEMPDDDTTEPLGATIDPARVMAETLALALPDYPRAPDAALSEAVFTEDGVSPMTDDDVRPFAGLKGLRDKLEQKDD